MNEEDSHLLARVTYNSENHKHAAFSQFNYFRSNQQLCDVVINVGNKKILAHRIILSACSPYFRAMFTGNLAEPHHTEITMSDVHEDALELLINFCYTSSIIIDESIVTILLVTANYIQLNEIEDICCEFLKRQLNLWNYSQICEIANTYSCHELLRVAIKFITKNFQQIIEGDEFKSITVEQLVNILDKINLNSQEQVFDALMKWIEADVSKRTKHLSELLKHVQLHRLDKKTLLSKVAYNKFVKSNDECRKLVEKAKIQLLYSNKQPSTQGSNPSVIDSSREILFVVGGWFDHNALSIVEYYDPDTADWTLVASMVKKRCGVGTSVVNGILYAIGGHDGQDAMNSVEKYDPTQKMWSSECAVMPLKRTSMGVATVGDNIYVIGGQDTYQHFNSVIKYDPNINIWSSMASMTTARVGVAVGIIDSCIYAIGGSSGEFALNTVERYDPRENAWCLVSPMSVKRKHFGCSAFNNCIYAVGGCDDQSELRSVEIYDLRANSWRPSVEMASRRSGVGVATINNRVYAVGGFNGTNYLKTVEIFDAEKNKWRMCAATMHYGKLGSGVSPVMFNFI